MTPRVSGRRGGLKPILYLPIFFFHSMSAVTYVTVQDLTVSLLFVILGQSWYIMYKLGKIEGRLGELGKRLSK